MTLTNFPRIVAGLPSRRDIRRVGERKAVGRARMVLRGLALAFAVAPQATLAVPTTAATADLPAICEAAAAQASKASGVPISVLKAIALTETGRRADGVFRPWPWTVNMEGKGFWFDTRPEAQAFVDKNFDRGARSFDVGCFQINYRWHHEHFASKEEMFDPAKNAAYAAEFLSNLFAEQGSWEKAAGAYHSRTAVHAEGYSKRFQTLRAKFAHEDGVPLPDIPAPLLASIEPDATSEAPRLNSYPLLQRGGAGALGSLVPQSASRGGSLFPVEG